VSQPSQPNVSTLMAGLSAEMQLLHGWQQIATYCQKSPRTLRRYRAREGFPTFRWGRSTYSHPQAILAWLAERERARRVRKGL
jgi:hypothetical protein